MKKKDFDKLFLYRKRHIIVLSFGVDMSKFPTIERLDADLAKIPEFRKANAVTDLIATILENKDVTVENEEATEESRYFYCKLFSLFTTYLIQYVLLPWAARL